MSLLRFVARGLFASHCIADGVSALRNTPERADEAEAFTDKAVPLVQRVVPAQYSSYVPEQPEQWIRLGGALKILGGAMFASGIGRRLGALLLIPATALDIVVAWPKKEIEGEERRIAQREALKNVAILGAAILGSRDLQGSPSLAWRAEQSRRAASKQASQLGNKTGRPCRWARRKAQRTAKGLAR